MSHIWIGAGKTGDLEIADHYMSDNAIKAMIRDAVNLFLSGYHLEVLDGHPKEPGDHHKLKIVVTRGP